METEQSSKTEGWKPGAGAFVQRDTGGRYENIRAKTRRRRFIANAVVVGSTGAVLLLAVFFHALLTR